MATRTWELHRRADIRLVVAFRVSLVVALGLSALSMALVMRGHDYTHHVYRVQELAWLWTHGSLWPSLSPFLAQGSLLPVYALYSPAPYVLPVGLHLLGLSAWPALALVATGAMLLLAVSLYDWFCTELGDERGTVAAGLVLFSNYCLGELLVRFAYAELLALACAPFALRSGWAFLRAPTHSGFARACSWASAVFMLHPLTFANTVVFASVFVIAEAWLRDGPRLASVQVGRLAGVALSVLIVCIAVTWPALRTLSEVRGQAEIAVEWRSLWSWVEPMDYRAIGVGLPALALMGWARRPADSETVSASSTSVQRALLATAAVAFVLASPLSAWLWETSSWPRVNLFPFRLLPYGMAPLAVWTCARLSLARGTPHIAFVVVLLGAAVFSAPKLWFGFERAGRSRPTFDAAAYAAQHRGWGIDEFLPRDSGLARVAPAQALPVGSSSNTPRSTTWSCAESECPSGRYALPTYWSKHHRLAIDGAPSAPAGIDEAQHPVVLLPRGARTVTLSVPERLDDLVACWVSLFALLAMIARATWRQAADLR